MLYELAVEAGASVMFNAGVCAVNVNESTERVEVTRNNGQVLYADVVVGADGLQSLVREAVMDREDDGVDTGMSVYT
jgi:salicylate hydroxylase